jgi:serine/threonine protein kinase
MDVAVKVLTKSAFLFTSRGIGNGNGDFSEVQALAWKEAKHVIDTRNNLLDKDVIIRVYGVVEGGMPESLTSVFRLPAGEEGVGIVMRYEGGGSLETLLHEKSSSVALKVADNIRIVREVSRGLVELHSVGVIHADLKPGNILLSHHNPPEIRLADFGSSFVSDSNNNGFGNSTLNMTSGARGTPIYRAPEMLVNPLITTFDESVARASRKTDMYAFGLILWEVFSRQKPYIDFKTEVTLSAKVHQGIRPSLDKVAKDTPPGIIALIQCDWSGDRSERKTAIENLSILRHHDSILSSQHFDVFFSHAWASKPFLSNVFHLLNLQGFRVWYDQFEMGHDMVKSMSEGIENSSVVLVCASQAYQSSAYCMFELQSSISLQKPVVTLLTERDALSWATDDFSQLCGLNPNTNRGKNQAIVDISSLVNEDWGSEEGVSMKAMKALNVFVTDLVAHIQLKGAVPSLKS